MPASTGTHCSRRVSHRGVIVSSCAVVLVALASWRAAASLSARWTCSSFGISVPSLVSRLGFVASWSARACRRFAPDRRSDDAAGLATEAGSWGLRAAGAEFEGDLPFSGLHQASGPAGFARDVAQGANPVGFLAAATQTYRHGQRPDQQVVDAARRQSGPGKPHHPPAGRRFASGAPHPAIRAPWRHGNHLPGATHEGLPFGSHSAGADALAGSGRRGHPDRKSVVY